MVLAIFCPHFKKLPKMTTKAIKVMQSIPKQQYYNKWKLTESLNLIPCNTHTHEEGLDRDDNSYGETLTSVYKLKINSMMRRMTAPTDHPHY